MITRMDSDIGRLMALLKKLQIDERTSAKDYYASLHRVAYYGDHTRHIRHLAQLMGLKVVQEA